MELVPFEMRAWQLNQTYELIKNCQVVKPPYDKNGFYSAEFFLDKRNGLEAIVTDPTKKFLDNINIEWQEYYYYTEETVDGTFSSVGVISVDVLTGLPNITRIGWPFSVDANSPKRMAYGKNIYWPTIEDAKVRDPNLWANWTRTFNVEWVDGYDGAFVKLQYEWAWQIEAWDYIVFKWDSSILKGWLNRVQDVDYCRITENRLIAEDKITVPLSNIHFFTVGLAIWLVPYVGSTSIAASVTVVSIDETTGVVTISAPIVSEQWDEIHYGNSIYIIGTNARWSVPKIWDEFDIYKNSTSKESNCIMIGHNNWSGGWTVSMLLLNGTYEANRIDVLIAKEKIVDIINFEQNLFVLTSSRLYFSRTAIDDNTQFYPLDCFKIDKGIKLFPMGKALFLYGRKNKLFSTINVNITATTWDKDIYAGYDINYYGQWFSKYSAIFSDQTIYFLQSDLQLMQIDIIANNNSTYDIATKNILLNTRGIFENVDTSDLNISVSTKYLNYVFVKDGTSTVYQFDKQYQHWMVNEYKDLVINKLWDIVLLDWYIAKVGTGFTDFGTEYEQEVNYALNGWVVRMNMPYFLRTVFWMTPNPFDVKMNMEVDIGGKTLHSEFHIKNLDLDNRLSVTLTGDELIWEVTLPMEATEYNGNNFSFQMPILKTWRYIRFKYNSFQRFSIGDSTVFVDFTKPFINEINKTI